MSVCRHELGGGSTPQPRQFQPWAYMKFHTTETALLTDVCDISASTAGAT